MHGVNAGHSTEQIIGDVRNTMKYNVISQVGLLIKDALTHRLLSSDLEFDKACGLLNFGKKQIFWMSASLIYTNIKRNL